MPNNNLAELCREIARRFLLTAVVVDDELSVTTDPAGSRRLDGTRSRVQRGTAEVGGSTSPSAKVTQP